MSTRLKSLIPLPLRTRLKWLGYALRDVIDPVRTPRVPPRRHTFIGGGDFEAVGNNFFKTLKRCGLTPDMDVLDVGCGQGRMARPLISFLDEGSYTGFDIVGDGIKWCQAHYNDAPSFTFIHADVFNERYNPGGTTPASEYRFPCDDNRFDLTFLTSVFTHMFRDDIENYLSEIARSLRPGGTCLITWFLLDDVSRKAKDTKLDFRFEVDAVSKTTLRENPEAAIAFDIDFVRALYAKAGLEIMDIEHGYWARADCGHQFQDMIIARKG